MDHNGATNISLLSSQASGQDSSLEDEVLSRMPTVLIGMIFEYSHDWSKFAKVLACMILCHEYTLEDSTVSGERSFYLKRSQFCWQKVGNFEDTWRKLCTEIPQVYSDQDSSSTFAVVTAVHKVAEDLNYFRLDIEEDTSGVTMEELRMMGEWLPNSKASDPLKKSLTVLSARHHKVLVCEPVTTNTLEQYMRQRFHNVAMKRAMLVL